MAPRPAPLRVVVALAAAASAALADCNAGAPRAPTPPQINVRPTIGVLSVPIASDSSPCVTSSASASCFSAFYFRWLESAGARAVILPVSANASLLASLLDGVNGVLLTGGELEDLAFDTPYMRAAAAVYTAALAKNDAGVFFPIHGTCQGMQVLALLTSQNQSVMQYGVYDSENYSLPLDVTQDGHHASRLLSANLAPPDIVNILMTQNVTLNLHHDGVAPDAFYADAQLPKFYVLASTNADRKGKLFVSTMEACNYPITATQWHPERPQFEWRQGLDINHGEDAVAANAYVARFFVADARRNSQRFADAQLFARYSVFSFPVVSAPDAAESGYQWIVADV